MLILGDIVDADRCSDAVAVFVAELLVKWRVSFELLVRLEELDWRVVAVRVVDGACGDARLLDAAAAASFAVPERHGCFYVAVQSQVAVSLNTHNPSI